MLPARTAASLGHWLLVGLGLASVFVSTIAVVGSLAFYVSRLSAARSAEARAAHLRVLRAKGPAAPPDRVVPAPPGKEFPVPELALDRLIYLDAPADPKSFPAERDNSLLTRELMRQAFLLAAREEFGWHTRDGVLREPVPAQMPKEHRFNLIMEVNPVRSSLTARVEIGDATGRRLLFDGILPGAIKDGIGYREQAATAEALSRTSFAELLAKSGGRRRGSRFKAHAPLPPATEAQLGNMALAAQFAAARQIHAALEADGDSPERLGGLVRAYAHLALLTEHLWSTDAEVFKARALLYAERLRFHQPDEAWGSWHRAYAAALGGLSAEALADLQRARERAGDTRAPEWVAVIEPLCRFDDAELAKLAKGPGLQGLIPLLQYVVVEDLNADQPGITRARSLLRDNPTCTRVLYGVARSGAKENRGQRADRYLQACAQAVPAQLGAMPGLPKAVRTALASAPTPWHALQVAGDTDGGEPSWGSLGHLLREDRFSAMWCRAALMEPGAPDFVLLGASRAIFKDHPLADLLDLYGVDPRREREAYGKRVAALPLGELRIHHTGIFEVYQKGLPDQGAAIAQRAFAHLDRCNRDYAAALFYIAEGNARASVAKELLRICPHAPSAIEVLIRWDGANQPPTQIAAWQKSESHQAPVLRGFVARAQATGNAGEIERALRRYLARAPDCLGYRQLADLYQTQGKKDLWRATLEECLKQPEQEAGHDEIRIVIANALMKEKRWQEAKPYAEAVAKTETAGAMDCLARYYEGLGQWEQAEAWTRRGAQRFPSNRFAYVFWCLRTGKGALAEARAKLDQELRELGESLSGEDLRHAAVYYTLLRQPAASADLLRRVQESERGEANAIFYALACDEAGRRFRRDEALQQFLNKQTSLAFLAERFRALLEQGDQGELEITPFDKILAEMPLREQGEGAYFVARFLEARGRAKDAVPYLQRCIANGEAAPEIQVLASARLRDHAAPRPR